MNRRNHHSYPRRKDFRMPPRGWGKVPDKRAYVQRSEKKIFVPSYMHALPVRGVIGYITPLEAVALGIDWSLYYWGLPLVFVQANAIDLFSEEQPWLGGRDANPMATRLISLLRAKDPSLLPVDDQEWQ